VGDLTVKWIKAFDDSSDFREGILRSTPLAPRYPVATSLEPAILSRVKKPSMSLSWRSNSFVRPQTELSDPSCYLLKCLHTASEPLVPTAKSEEHPSGMRCRVDTIKSSITFSAL